MKQFSLYLCLLIVCACSKPGNPAPQDNLLPEAETDSITAIKFSSALSGGYILSQGADSVTERGLCYSTLPGPTITSQKLVAGKGIGYFSARLTGLTPNSTYYVRAFGTNSKGTGYGKELSFKTPELDSAKLIFTGGANALYCFNAKDGVFKWAKTLGAWVTSSPCYANGLVYVGCEDSYLYAFDTTGILKWSANTGRPIERFSPVVSNGVVFINNDKFAIAYNAVTGAEKWKFDVKTYPSNISGIYTGLTLANNTIYLNCNVIYALNAETGAVKWTSGTTYYNVYMKPKVVNNKLYTFYYNNWDFMALDASNGSLIWKKHIYSTGNGISVNVYDRLVYFYNEGLTVMDTLNGDIKWTSGGGNDSRSHQAGSSPVISDGFIHLVSGGGVIVRDALTGAFNYQEYGRAGDVAILEGDVTVLNGFSYYGTRDVFNTYNGYLRATGISADGTLNSTGWRSTVKSDFRTTPCVVTASGKMYRAGDVY